MSQVVPTLLGTLGDYGYSFVGQLETSQVSYTSGDFLDLTGYPSIILDSPSICVKSRI